MTTNDNSKLNQKIALSKKDVQVVEKRKDLNGQEFESNYRRAMIKSASEPRIGINLEEEDIDMDHEDEDVEIIVDEF